ncbi:MAG: hypothetical protein Q9187_000421 [Circinaria calcarea]
MSPLRPLHRCLKSISNGSIAIIDLQYLALHQSCAYPRLYNTGDVIHQFGIRGVNLKTGQKYYSNRAREFLFGERIEAEAILVVFSKSDFLEYSKTHPKLRKMLRLDTFQEAKTANENTKGLKRTGLKAIGHSLALLTGVETGYHDYLRQLLLMGNLPTITVVIERLHKPQKGAEKDLEFFKSRERIENMLGLNGR